jgi:hypothetical protein
VKKVLTMASAALVALAGGCGGHQDNAPANAPARMHVARPPHGGTPVALNDDYQLEWVLDAPAGKLQVYVLDGEMENFIRIAPPAFDLTVQLPGRRETLRLAAIANRATGEKVGSTSLFEAGADWLKTNHSFEAILPEIDVQGTVFSNVAFSFPNGDQAPGR